MRSTTRSQGSDLVAIGLRLSCCLLFLVLGSGCAVIHKEISKEHADEEFVRMAALKRVHVDEVLEELGPPGAISALPDGYVFLYQQFQVEEKQVGISTRVIPVLSLFKLAVAKADLDEETLMMRFDHEGWMQAAGLRMEEDELGRGRAVQPVFSIVPLVDTSSIESPHRSSNSWGMDLLRDPPVTLNSNQSLDSGEAGLELRGTPDKVGQRALEMQKPDRSPGRKRR